MSPSRSIDGTGGGERGLVVEEEKVVVVDMEVKEEDEFDLKTLVVIEAMNSASEPPRSLSIKPNTFTYK